MMKLERSPSHSWWWNSHNSPKHSKWLQSNLQELDDKVKEMLRLIEEDADSFAQRAEMYYQKRPELVNLVEEFYRAYRSLAERYDHLTGEIRQNIPRALQAQYGLSCDSPKSMGVQHRYSPLRKSNQMFDSLLRKAGRTEDKMEDSRAVDQIQTPARMNIEQNGLHHSCIEHFNDNHNYDCGVEFLTKERDLSPEGGMKSSSDSETEHLSPMEKLQQEISLLETENRLLADSHRKVLELNTALQRKVETLEDQCKVVQSEAKGEVDRLNEGRLVKGTSTISMEDNDLSATGKEMQGGDNAQQKPDLCVDDHDVACCFGEDAEVANHADVVQCDYLVKLDSLQQQFAGGVQKKLMGLMEENRKHKLAILERGEEKREAIRQLCFSMDMLKLENQRLVIMLGSMKKRLNALSSGTASAVAPPQVSPNWKKVLCLGD